MSKSYYRARMAPESIIETMSTILKMDISEGSDEYTDEQRYLLDILLSELFEDKNNVSLALRLMCMSFLSLADHVVDHETSRIGEVIDAAAKAMTLYVENEIDHHKFDCTCQRCYDYMTTKTEKEPAMTVDDFIDDVLSNDTNEEN